MNTEPGEWLIWILGIIIGLALSPIFRSVGRYFRRTEDLDGDYRGELPPAAAPTQEEEVKGESVRLTKDCDNREITATLCRDEHGRWMAAIGGGLVPNELMGRIIVCYPGVYDWKFKNHAGHILCIPTRKFTNKEEE